MTSLASIDAYVADTLWATRTPARAAHGRAGAATSLDVTRATRCRSRSASPRAPSPAPFRLGIAREGIGVIQPGGALATVAVVAEEGETFPFWTRTGSLVATSLKTSYSNFPNPFAAGRSPTTFVYALASDARVTLRVWTASGDEVVTLLSSAPRSAGLHQQDRWDGRNGAGRVVTHGAYLAELIVEYIGGGRERVLRKVAVVR